jgi:predicted Zn-dependent protease
MLCARREQRVASAGPAVLLAFWLVTIPTAALADASEPFGWLFSDLNLVSTQQESEIAKNLAREIESHQRVLGDAEVQDYVSGLGRRLVGALRRSEFRYRFRVVSDPAVNAFGIGGGYIYVNDGLLAAVDTEGEVAAVLAHEIGHQARRHVAKQISRQAVFESLLRAAIGSHSSQWVDLAAGLGITTGQLYLGREAEREADTVMVELMPHAGYDPHQALAMFAKLRAIQGSDPGAVATLFSSHPPTSERSESVRREIARLQLPGGLVRDSRRFQEIRRRVASGLRRR